MYASDSTFSEPGSDLISLSPYPFRFDFSCVITTDTVVATFGYGGVSELFTVVPGK